MKLTELEPDWMLYIGNGLRDTKIEYPQAQGIMFACPKCFATNNGLIGTHYVEVTFQGKNVPDNEGSHNKEGKPTRWNASGTGFGDLTLTPSILLNGGCEWHGYITNGEATSV